MIISPRLLILDLHNAIILRIIKAFNRTRIKDIAQKANVSIGTVGRVIGHDLISENISYLKKKELSIF